MSWFPRAASGLAALVIALVLLLGTPFTARASLLKPTYAAGDKWVYILEGLITEFPGLNASQIRNLRFDLVGMVDVKVIGPANFVVGNASVPSVRVDTRATGYLNGSFSVQGGGTAQVTGTFTIDTSEFWEDQAYLPISSNSTTSYRARRSSVMAAQIDVPPLPSPRSLITKRRSMIGTRSRISRCFALTSQSMRASGT